MTASKYENNNNKIITADDSGQQLVLNLVRSLGNLFGERLPRHLAEAERVSNEVSENANKILERVKLRHQNKGKGTGSEELDQDSATENMEINTNTFGGGIG